MMMRISEPQVMPISSLSSFQELNNFISGEETLQRHRNDEGERVLKSIPQSIHCAVCCVHHSLLSCLAFLNTLQQRSTRDRQWTLTKHYYFIDRWTTRNTNLDIIQLSALSNHQIIPIQLDY